MNLISKEINGVTFYLTEKESYYLGEIPIFIPKVKFVTEINKWEYTIIEDAQDGDEHTVYFDTIQDIIHFLGLDIEEEK